MSLLMFLRVDRGGDAVFASGTAPSPMSSAPIDSPSGVDALSVHYHGYIGKTYGDRIQ